MRLRLTSLSALTALALAGCASSQTTPPAPQPTKPINTASFFQGRWYELARTPISLTDGCVAGTTDFYQQTNQRLIERDACRKGSPEGPEKIFKGPIHILNPGENNKFTVHYTLFYVVPFTVNYWVLDHGDDWFIISTPSFKEISILDRNPRPSAVEIKTLVGHAQALGYDISKLEYPPLFPPGAQ